MSRPLPVGRHDLTREQVAASQRQRLEAALDELILFGPTPTGVLVHQYAGVSKRTIYETWPTFAAAVQERARILRRDRPVDSLADALTRALLSTRAVAQGNVTGIAADLLVALLGDDVIRISHT